MTSCESRFINIMRKKNTTPRVASKNAIMLREMNGANIDSSKKRGQKTNKTLYYYISVNIVYAIYRLIVLSLTFYCNRNTPRMTSIQTNIINAKVSYFVIVKPSRHEMLCRYILLGAQRRTREFSIELIQAKPRARARLL